jgi:putative membrane protein
MKLLIRWLATCIALLLAAWIVPGIRVERESFAVFGMMAIILGLVNAIIRPLLKMLSCTLIILTLGLFTLVINGVTLMLASWIARHWFNVGFYVDGFIPAFLGALIVSVVTVTLTTILGDDKKNG